MILRKSNEDIEKDKLAKQEKYNSKMVGKTFIKFAWLPIRLRCGRIIWLEKYCRLYSLTLGGFLYVGYGDYDEFIMEFPKYERNDIVY